MATKNSSSFRGSEFVAAIIVVAGLAAMQIFVGGTRLVFSLPIYGLLGLAGLLALFSLRASKPLPARSCLWASALFFAYLLLRASFSPVPYLARTDIFSILAGLLIYLAAACLFTSARLRMAMLLSLVVLALVQVVIGAIQFRRGDNFMLISFLQRFDYGRRASGFYACPNHFAGALEVLGVYCLSIACWSRWPLWVKLLVGYAGAVCYAGLALTGSRGGYLSAGVGLLVFSLLTLLAVRRLGATVFWRTAGVGAVCLLLVFGGLVFGFKKSPFLSDRAQNVIDTQNIRLDLWRAALAEWKLQPFVGTGSGTYLYYGRHFRSERVQLDPVEVHNDYLQLLAEYGALGAAGFLLFFGTHLCSGVAGFRRLGPARIELSGRLPSNSLALNIGSLGALASYVVHSVFDFNLHIPANVCLLGFVFGLLANPGSLGGRERSRERAAVAWERLALPLIGLLLIGAALRYGPAEAFAEKARVALRDERHLAAMRWAQEAIRRDDQDPETWFYLGESRVRRAEGLNNPAASRSYYASALDPLQRAWALAPNDETFLIALGRVYDALGRFPEAEWMFGRALAWDPRSQVVQKSYAAHLVLWRRGEMGTFAPERVDLPEKNAPLPTPTPAP